jgi:alpha-galactosidase
LTPDEQYSHVTLWCLLAAPLILSGDITRLDAFTLSLLSNDEILAVDQDPLGKPAHRVLSSPGVEIWARPLADGSQAVGLFNRDAYDACSIEIPWAALNLQGERTVRDLWRQKDLGHFRDSFRTSVPPHGVAALQIR